MSIDTRAAGPAGHSGPTVVVALGGSHGLELADLLRDAGAVISAVVDRSAPAAAAVDALAGREAAEVLGALARADVLVVDGGRDALTADLVAVCDRFGVRIAALCDSPAARRTAAVFGVTAYENDVAPRDLLAAVGAPAHVSERPRGRIITVWGAAGAPGRTRMAIELACELARDGRRVGLVDADAHAPSIAMTTGLADEGPGFAAACRQAGRGALTTTELSRIASPLGDIEVLTGINRPARWPELSHERVSAALEQARDWADDVIVDVAASLERDEEIVSDLDGPRRNAATLAALEAADLVVAVVAADPVGVSRFLRAHADLRAVVGARPVRIVVNKTRTATLGMDARGQVRRTFERYASAREVWFVPWDPKAADAATLAARPVAEIAGRSALAGAVRRFVGEAIDPPATSRPAAQPGRARSRERARGAARGDARTA
ncbi:MAG: P-loop NTPase [Microbacterium sp.]